MAALCLGCDHKVCCLKYFLTLSLFLTHAHTHTHIHTLICSPKLEHALAQHLLFLTFQSLRPIPSALSWTLTTTSSLCWWTCTKVQDYGAFILFCCFIIKKNVYTFYPFRVILKIQFSFLSFLIFSLLRYGQQAGSAVWRQQPGTHYLHLPKPKPPLKKPRPLHHHHTLLQ